MSIDSIKTVAVLGAGTMGNGIAHVLARAGYTVILRDVEQRFRVVDDDPYARVDHVVGHLLGGPRGNREDADDDVLLADDVLQAALVVDRLGVADPLREIPRTCFRTARGTVARQVLGLIVDVELTKIDGGFGQEILRLAIGL